MKLVSRYDSDIYCKDGRIFSTKCGHEYEYSVLDSSSIVVIDNCGVSKSFHIRYKYVLFYTEREVRRMKLKKLENV